MFLTVYIKRLNKGPNLYTVPNFNNIPNLCNFIKIYSLHSTKNSISS